MTRIIYRISLLCGQDIHASNKGWPGSTKVQCNSILVVTFVSLFCVFCLLSSTSSVLSTFVVNPPLLNRYCTLCDKEFYVADTLCVGGRESLFAASSRFCFQFQFNRVALLVATYFLALSMPLRKRGVNTSLLFPRTRNL